ncbi:MAG TPA: hypothetical protein VKZ73_00225 [Microbacterium sp.]|nr:hypothetical protein [Microbacterium sp.]
MSIEVTQGSIVAVDPDELRMAATRVENAAYHASSAMAEVSAADALQRDNPIPELRDMWPCGLGILEECRAVYDDSRALADGLRLAADTYELIELRTLDLMYPNGDPGIRRRLHHLALAYPGTNDMADHLWRAWQGLTGSGLVENWAHSGAQAGAMMAIFVNQLVKMRTGAGLGRGSLGEPERVAARAGRVPGVSDRYMPMERSRIIRTLKAPTGLEDSFARIPSGESDDLSDRARVRIEKYRMQDGSEKFVAYLSGSREKPWQTDDPFCWANNVGLYLGQADSDGYDFVLEALERAGAAPGSVVDVNAFSQGSMLAQRLATDSDFDVRRVTTLGAPLRIPMGDDVTSLTFAHDDDPVAALSDGGSPMRLGDDDSLLVTRVFDDKTEGLAKWSVGAHRVSAYAETARIFEESGDPRGAEVREYFEELSHAALLESFAYEVPEEEIGKLRGGASSSGGEG